MTVASIYVNELLEILKSTSNAESSFKIRWDMEFGKLLTAIRLVMYLLKNATGAVFLKKF